MADWAWLVSGFVVLAAIRNESDIAVGHIVGSNFFNLTAIMGASALLRPLRLSGISWGDAGAILAAATLLLPLAHRGSKLNRREAVLFMACYVGHVLYRANVFATMLRIP